MGTSQLAQRFLDEGVLRYAPTYHPGKRIGRRQLLAALQECVKLKDLDGAHLIRKEVQRDLDLFQEKRWEYERRALAISLRLCDRYILRILAVR